MSEKLCGGGGGLSKGEKKRTRQKARAPPDKSGKQGRQLKQRFKLSEEWNVNVAIHLI